MDNRITLTLGNELDYLLEADITGEARQKVSLNESSTLEFSMRRSSPKAKYFNGAAVEAEVNGRLYCVLGDDSIKDEINDSSGSAEDSLLNVTMKELWYKLTKSYVTTYNLTVPSSEFDHIDTHMVVLLGDSKDPLYIDGTRRTASYPVGTAKYLMWCLLYGTGWSLDTRYDAYWPDGTFDLETDKKSRYENIEVVQSLFGGFLLWDSKGKRVALIDEAKYQVDDGFQVKYGVRKGVLLKSMVRTENRDVATRVYPYGNGNLNIAKVNSNKEYLENFTYTNEVLTAIIQHSDIYKQETLLAWAKKELAKMCKPRYSYSVTLLDNREQEGPQGVGPEIAKMCTVYDPKQPSGKISLRTISVDQNVFQHWDVKIEVGDMRDKWPTVMRDIQRSEKTVTNTVSNTNQISGLVVRGETPALTASNVHWTGVTNTLDAGVKTNASGIGSLNTKTDNIQLEVNDNKGHIAGLYITTEQISTRVEDVNRGLHSEIVQTADSINLRVTNEVAGLQGQLTVQSNRIAGVITQDGRLVGSAVLAALMNGEWSQFKVTANQITLAASGGSISLQGNVNVMQGLYLGNYEITKASDGTLRWK